MITLNILAPDRAVLFTAVNRPPRGQGARIVLQDIKNWLVNDSERVTTQVGNKLVISPRYTILPTDGSLELSLVDAEIQDSTVLINQFNSIRKVGSVIFQRIIDNNAPEERVGIIRPGIQHGYIGITGAKISVPVTWEGKA